MVWYPLFLFCLYSWCCLTKVQTWWTWFEAGILPLWWKCCSFSWDPPCIRGICHNGWQIWCCSLEVINCDHVVLNLIGWLKISCRWLFFIEGGLTCIITTASFYIVFKSLVLGPQKDRRLNRTGPKKDQTAVVVRALWWSVWLRLHEFEGNAKTGPRPVATGFIEDQSYVSVHRENSMQISIPVYLWEYMVVFNILYVTYTWRLLYYHAKMGVPVFV